MKSSDYIAGWIRYMEHNLGRADETLSRYEKTINELEAWLIEREHSFLSVFRALLDEFTGIKAFKEGKSNASRKPLIAAVKSFFKYLHAEDIRDDNPARHIDYPKPGKPLPIPISQKNVDLLFKAIDMSSFIGVRDAAIIAMFVGTGLRVSGLASLNQSSLMVAELNDQQHMFVRVKEKGKKERIVPLPDVARIFLQAYLGHEELESIDRLLPDGDQVLFVSTNNRFVQEHEYYGEARRLAVRTIQSMVIKYGEVAGIPREQLHPHAFRHLYGTELAEHNVDLKRIQLLMGHADISSTSVYIHLAVRQLVDVVEQSSALNKIDSPMRYISEHMKLGRSSSL